MYRTKTASEGARLLVPFPDDLVLGEVQVSWNQNIADVVEDDTGRRGRALDLSKEVGATDRGFPDVRRVVDAEGRKFDVACREECYGDRRARKPLVLHDQSLDERERLRQLL